MTTPPRLLAQTTSAPDVPPLPATRVDPPDWCEVIGRDAESLRVLALVQSAQEGDGEAFGQLFDAYSDAVYRYIYYRVGNKPSAEDLTSETFLRALRRISTFTSQDRDFGAWLTAIAGNLVTDHCRALSAARASRPRPGPASDARRPPHQRHL